MSKLPIERTPLAADEEEEFKWVARWFNSRQYEDDASLLIELPEEEITQIYRDLEDEALECARGGNFAPLAVLIDTNGPFGSKVKELRSCLSSEAWELVVQKLEDRAQPAKGRKKLSSAQKADASSTYQAAASVPMIEFLIKQYRDPSPTASFYDQDIRGTACDYAARLSGDPTLDAETVRDRVRKTPARRRSASH